MGQASKGKTLAVRGTNTLDLTNTGVFRGVVPRTLAPLDLCSITKNKSKIPSAKRSLGSSVVSH